MSEQEKLPWWLFGRRVARTFRNHTDWVNHAETNVAESDLCVDSDWKVLRNGADFEQAKWPVKVYRVN